MRPEIEFSKKPRRMTSPPQNQRLWFYGTTGVEVIMETDPARMAYFAREATWGDLLGHEPTKAELADTLEEVSRGGVLGAAYKGGMGFRIRASRSTMDQALRLAEGSGGAGSGAGAQTTRDNDMRDFNIIVPETIERLADTDLDLYGRVQEHIRKTRQLYADLVDAGIPPQDARYVSLPLGFQTQWFHILSLGNLIKMCEHRLCNGLVQTEINYLTRIIRDIVVCEYPWMDKQLRSSCEKRGQCASKTMLFPPCGAFIESYPTKTDDEVRLEVTQYDPDLHLYPADQNSAMEFANWDVERQALEAAHPGHVFSMAGPPLLLIIPD